MFLFYLFISQCIAINFDNYEIEKHHGSDFEGDYEYINEVKVYKEVVNPFSFKYLLNPGEKICGPDHGKDVYLLVLVNTAPHYYQRRNSLRNTWASVAMFKDIRVVYVMGSVEERRSLTKHLQLESNLYGDIVQGDFEDGYRKLVEKGRMALKWTTDYCSNAKYILKIDDDMLVNMFFLLRHLSRLETSNELKDKTIVCAYQGAGLMSVIRDPYNKWYVSVDEYSPAAYSQYCSGCAYVMTSDLIKDMYNVAFYIKYVWVDDFFLSGLVASAANTKYIQAQDYLYFIYETDLEKHYKYSIKSKRVAFAHTWHPNIVYNTWNVILKSQFNEYPSLLSVDNAGIRRIGDFVYLNNYYWADEKFWNKYLDES